VEVIYLTGERIQQLHLIAIEAGGLDGLRSADALYASLGQVEQSFGDEDLYESIPEKAAAYAYFLTMNHPFLDGNKRVAALAMETFLVLNGYVFHQTDDEIADMMVSIAAGTVSQGEFFDWVVNHAKSVVSITERFE
jgi:death-on-curing protein